MPGYMPWVQKGQQALGAIKFAQNPTVSGGLSLAQAAVPYLTDDKTAQKAVGGLATGQKVYSALSGGLNKTATVGGTSLGATGGQLSGGIGMMSMGYNMSQGMTDPEAVGMQMMGNVLMMSGNPYLMAAGAVMQFVGPMLQDEQKIGANVTGKGTAKWGDNGLQAPSIYNNSSHLEQARGKGKEALRMSSTLDNLDNSRPTYEQWGFKKPEEMSAEGFDTRMAQKQQELADIQGKMKEASENPEIHDDVNNPSLGTYRQSATAIESELRDLEKNKANFEIMSPHALDTPKGKAFTSHDLYDYDMPVAHAGKGMSGDFGEVFMKGANDVTGAAVGKFNTEFGSVLAQMPPDKAEAIRGKLAETDFGIDYNKAWKKESVKADEYGKQLPGQFQRLGENIYDQLWGTVEKEFGIDRNELLPLVKNEQAPTLGNSQAQQGNPLQQVQMTRREEDEPSIQGSFGQTRRASIL
jgi:hypothetical protein